MTITKNCAASFIAIREKTADTLAQASSTLSPVTMIQASDADRTKRIARMELTNTYDNKACLGDFNKFVLNSAQLSNNYSTMFTFT